MDLINEYKIGFIIGGSIFVVFLVFFIFKLVSRKKKDFEDDDEITDFEPSDDSLEIDQGEDSDNDAKAQEAGHIVVLQGNRFDLNDDEDANAFIQKLNSDFELAETFETIFGAETEKIKENAESIIRLFDRKSDLVEIEARLKKIRSECDYFNEEVEKLKAENADDTESLRLIEEVGEAFDQKEYLRVDKLLAEYQNFHQQAEHNKEVVSVLCLKAINYLAQLKYAEALEEMKQAVGHDPENPECHFRLALYADELAEYSLAEASYKTALEYYERAGSEVLVADIHYNLGNASAKQGNHDASIDSYQRALNVRVSVLGEQHPDVANAYHKLGGAFYEKGDCDAAIDSYGKALEINISTFGEEHLNVANIYNDLGNVYRKKGNYDAAIDNYQKDLAITSKVFGDQHPSVAVTYNNIGTIHRIQGDDAAAIDSYQKALAIKTHALGDQHPSVANTYYNLGLIPYQKGDYSSAINYYRKARSIYSKLFPDGHPNLDRIKLKLQKAEQMARA